MKFFFISILFHLILFNLLYTLTLSNPHGKSGQTAQKGKKIQVTRVTPEELRKLKKLRTVGIKGGKKDIFSVPLTAPVPRPPSGSMEKSSPPSRKIKLSKLGVGGPVSFASTSSPTGSAEKKTVPSFQKYFDGKIKSNSEMMKSYPDLFRATDFNITVDTPEGVSADKLNSQEMIFYSFHKRVFEAYISSIFKAYENFKMKNPHLNLSQMGKQTLRARIQYDDQGNIRIIKNLEISQNGKIQEFFESILEGNRIPNPPRNILNKEAQFSLEFQLILNV